MSWTRRFTALFRGRSLDREVDEELRSHIEMRAADNVARGMSPEDARRRALLQFGNLAALKEETRGMDVAGRLEDLWRDFAYALRMLRKSPAFTATAVLTLALGMGANTAIFSIVYAVLLRPLPYPQPDELMAITFVNPKGEAGTHISPALILAMRDSTQSLREVSGFAFRSMNLTEAGEPARVIGHEVTANFLGTLGVAPAMGRDFTPDDERFGANRVILLTHEFWLQRFGGDAALVGRFITFDSEKYEVVGILPPLFQPPAQFGLAAPVSYFVPAVYPPDILRNPGEMIIRGVVRRKPGIGPEQAQADLDQLVAALTEEFPQAKGSRINLVPLKKSISGRIETSLWVLLGAVGLIVLIACVNVANLLLVRASIRRRDIAVRLALGASRWRLVRELAVQSTLLALLGCAAGLLFAGWSKDALIALAPPGVPRLESAALEWPVLAASAALALVVGLFFGLVPALGASRVSPGQALQTGARAGSDQRTTRWRSALMVAEVALSLMLLVSSSLLLRSFLRMNAAELGFESEHVVVANVALPQARYPDGARRLAFFEQVAERMLGAPGVRSLTFANQFPMRGGWEGGIEIELPDGEITQTSVEMQAVSRSYFETLGIALLRGRGFDNSDRSGAPPVTLVNAAFARRYFPGSDAVGRRFRRHPEAPWVTIVGVVGDIRRDGKDTQFDPGAYLHAPQTELYPVRLAEVAMRLSGDPQSAIAALQRAVWSLDAGQPVTNVKTLAEVASQSMAQRRFITALLALFAGLALALATVGVYGVISYSVAQRTSEIGVRMALGASRYHIAWSVLRQALTFAVAGVVLGVAGAAALSRYMTTLLFEVRPLDPASFAITSTLLLAVAVVAAALPARRAMSVDPMVALRYE